MAQQTKRKKDRADAEERKRIDMQRQETDEELARKLQYSLALKDTDNESCFDPDFDLASEDQVHKEHPSSTARRSLRSRVTLRVRVTRSEQDISADSCTNQQEMYR